MLTRTKPMSRGTVGLKRTAIVYKTRGIGPSYDLPARALADFQPDRAERLAARARAAMQSAAFTEQMKKLQDRRPALAQQAPVAINSIVSPQAAPITLPKEELLRSEPYRRLVAAMPCKACGIQGYSQHAHENIGKALGLKVDDRRGFALCTVAPGRVGCHELFDQYQLVEGGREAHRLLGEHWAAETRREINEAGLWPARLPQWTKEAV